ncbi:RFC5 (YBR087W) [Zygosaccharomyces parabailii]|uniref:ZYBA0S12-01530g1_1 n=1 Tax=Zygosaccharomyces bailii (strain CLIB 213 / ATCC 58445 / CBS 680 / BCRC 21525 / NBRC 1098 / NCYC 1416 / NRRL Y-2227) TaxID=1333698 RepID=A0A8J2TAJ5_ZYGB2|nr:RFC5 (YBR087W) [Zygosaccharomyces parabailii]CDF91552.1 ZYBA0S12-01530g1_1 [Zygosaccharomyces bailii CLIB 213]CDH11083.1 probable Replication factor C subunit 5 [Zygosaccharomyces bailii ISA1307]SJM86471.1 probable Replication factor C subunit 5 [Zygosaccharomyces bailii]
MSLWVDKYRPKKLNDLSHNAHLTSLLQSLSQQPRDLPHLLLYGPNGSGKKTRCMSLLESIFGEGVYKMKIDVRQFVTPSNRKLDLNVVSSAYHLEITPSDMGTNDRIVIQHLLKEVAQMEQVDFKDSRDGLAHRYKCVIINEADSLTRDAQAALRRTMEKYSRNIRLIMICDSVSSIISPIKSRCFMVRCPAPNEAEMVEILKQVSKEEKVNVDSDQIFEKIALESGGNLRKGLLMLEAMSLSNEMHLKKETPVMRPDWESVIMKLANKIQKEKSVGCLVECRSVLYDLLAHCIPARTILQELTFALLQSSKTDKTKVAIIETSSIFDERLSLGNKPIYHLEGFVARAMCSM